MRLIIASSLLAFSLSMAAPAMAKNVGFDTTVTSPVNSAVKIEIVFSEDMLHRANNLPEKLSDRSGARLNSGFSGNGFYGDREFEYLTKRLVSKLEHKFAKRGIETSDTASTILRVTIEDAKPNRPTHNQLSKQPGLSFSSFGIGGAELEAELVTTDGRSLGTMSYRWFENDIRYANQGGTWSDTYRAFGRFASRAAKTLAN